MKRAMLAATTAIALLTTSTAASAACALSDLSGSWRFQATGEMDDGDGGRMDLRADCRLQFNTTGRLTAMTCFPDRNIAMYFMIDPALDWTEYTSSQLGRNCWVKIDLSTYYGEEGIWLDGHMTPNKQAIMGTGELYADFGLIQFTMVRQSQ